MIRELRCSGSETSEREQEHKDASEKTVLATLDRRKRDRGSIRKKAFKNYSVKKIYKPKDLSKKLQLIKLINLDRIILIDIQIAPGFVIN